MNEVTPKAGPERAARTPALLHGYTRESAMKGAALYDEMPDSVAKTVFSQSLKDLAEEGLVSREHFALRLGTVLNPKSFLRTCTGYHPMNENGKSVTQDASRCRLRAVEAMRQTQLPVCDRRTPRTLLLSLLAPRWKTPEAVHQT